MAAAAGLLGLLFDQRGGPVLFASPRSAACSPRGNPSQRIAAALLVNPDRLLTAVLFWNLLVNVAYLASASVVGIRVGARRPHRAAGTFSVAAVLVIIVCGEMLPKSLAVLRPRFIAALVAVPLAAMVKLLDPLLGIFAARPTSSRNGSSGRGSSRSRTCRSTTWSGRSALGGRRRPGRAGAAGVGKHRAALGNPRR